MGSYRSWERVVSLPFLTKTSSLYWAVLWCATKDSILCLVHTGVPFLGRLEGRRRAVKASVHVKGVEMKLTERPALLKWVLGYAHYNSQWSGPGVQPIYKLFLHSFSEKTEKG